MPLVKKVILNWMHMGFSGCIDTISRTYLNCTDLCLVKVGWGVDDEGGCLRMSWCCGYDVMVVEMTRSDPGPWSWLRMSL